MISKQGLVYLLPPLGLHSLHLKLEGINSLIIVASIDCVIMIQDLISNYKWLTTKPASWKLVILFFFLVKIIFRENVFLFENLEKKQFFKFEINY